MIRPPQPDGGGDVGCPAETIQEESTRQKNSRYTPLLNRDAGRAKVPASAQLSAGTCRRAARAGDARGLLKSEDEAKVSAQRSDHQPRRTGPTVRERRSSGAGPNSAEQRLLHASLTNTTGTSIITGRPSAVISITPRHDEETGLSALNVKLTSAGGA